MLKNRRHEIYLLFGSLFFAISSIPAKLAMEAGLSAWRLTQIRTTGAFLILFLYVYAKNKKFLHIKRKELPILISFGVFGFAAVNLLYFLAIQRLNVGIALIIELTAPIWITLWLRFIQKRIVSKLMWWGLVIALSGLALIAQVWRGLTLDGLGVIYAILCAFALTIYFLVGEKLVGVKSSEATMALGLGVSSAFFAIIQPWWSFPFEQLQSVVQLTGRLSEISVPIYFLVLLVIVFGTAIPYFLVLTGLRGLSAATSSAIGMSEPVFGGIFAWIFLYEKLNFIQSLGAIVVLVGIYLANRARLSVKDAT
ncbi:MAG: EamA family transporter [Actinobacteria bacterium]|nr:EamA family transporter [Actinomycetota bacterium]MDA2982087.1 EamA family transporter [Actinomycetota bacterium]MDA2997117.1 EamA family transporter [Actinomycetota bacterium]